MPVLLTQSTLIMQFARVFFEEEKVANKFYLFCALFFS
jgi:hypothetical protein